MKKIFVLTALSGFLAIGFTSCSTDTSVSSDTMFPLAPAHSQIEPFNDGTGVVRVNNYAADGVILIQSDYHNNLREGVYSEFHMNGFVKSTVGYVRGKKEGLMLTLDDRGQVETRATYHNDILNGPYTMYNRTRIKEKRYYVDGKLTGELEKFYPNGTVMERTNYVEGQLDGIARWYDQEGNLTIEYTYRKGELVPEEE